MKIINVGLPKTGTTTLHLFLSKFFNSTHHCRNKTLKMKNNLEKGENIYEGINYECDCQPDFVIGDFCFFPQIINLEDIISANKESKFVLTMRENEFRWLKSIKYTQKYCKLYYRILNNIQKIPFLNEEYKNLTKDVDILNDNVLKEIYDYSLLKFYISYINYVKKTFKKHNIELFELNIDSKNTEQDNAKFKNFIKDSVKNKDLLKEQNLFSIHANKSNFVLSK